MDPLAVYLAMREADCAVRLRQPQQPDLIQLLTPEGERVEHPDYALDVSDEELRGLYRDLCFAQRGAFSAYLDLGRYRILSASPELFFELRDGRVVMRPMKGTRPRGRWREEDEARVIREVTETFARNEGQAPKGWMGAGTYENLSQAVTRGADGLVIKPFSHADLQTAVAAAASSPPRVPPPG